MLYIYTCIQSESGVYQSFIDRKFYWLQAVTAIIGTVVSARCSPVQRCGIWP